MMHAEVGLHDGVLILAAGKGTRMKSRTAKVLHPVLGKAMIEHVLDVALAAGFTRPRVVLASDQEDVAERIGQRGEVVIQPEQNGTGGAVKVAMEREEPSGDVLVLYGDVPLLRAQTVGRLWQSHKASGIAATVLTAELADPTGYGRIVRDGTGAFREIVEERDATPEQKAIHEMNTGIYVFRAQYLRDQLNRLTTHNTQSEYYLSDTIAGLVAAGQTVGTVLLEDVSEALGINDRKQLADATRALRLRILAHWMEAGVTIVDPESTVIEPDVRLEADVVIEPFSTLRGDTQVAAGAVIGPRSDVSSSRIGSEAQVVTSVVEESVVGAHCMVGPFAHLRAGSDLGPHVHVGNFAEVKNSSIGEHTKAHHHSYLGDATIGERVNIGAGTVIVNYDGVQKHRTVIGDGAFIGCNANLVAPVTIEPSAYVAAGSTITKTVPEGALGIARARQQNLEGWVDRKRRPKGENR